jgi:hypothetical protein
MARSRVYIDANVFKFSATSLPRLRPREVETAWGPTKQLRTIHDFIIDNPNDRIKNNPELKREAELLSEVASLATVGLAEFVINVETRIEMAGLPNLDSETGRFYGAPLKDVDAPVQYGRIMFGGGTNYRDAQFDSLCLLKDKRFHELQCITGAYQGEMKRNRNQLLDAFHLWCAEYAKCDFFLSLDFKLARMIANSKVKPNVPVVKPSVLLMAVRSGD